MAELKIDRLTLKLSGLSARDGERLARLVAEGLGSVELTNERSHSIGEMRVSVAAGGKGSIERLSEQIVASVLRQLERTL